jgi:hypothetical protein
MPTPTTDADNAPGIIDQRNALLAGVAALSYGVLLLVCGLMLWGRGAFGQSEIGFLTALSVGYPLHFLAR